MADFGLTKDVYDRNYYRAIKHEKVPARWMPLESLVNGLWSEKSDVVSLSIEKEGVEKRIAHCTDVMSQAMLATPNPCPPEYTKLDLN